MPVTKQEEGTSSKLRVVDHLKALAGDSNHLCLWLDCDAEGENIAFEVLAVTRRAILSNNPSSDDGVRRIHRAKFSAITPKAIQDAFVTMEEPDAALSRSVDARQELDLRIGVAMTRLLTWRCIHLARRANPATRMISYGPCQTPALSFCIDRMREIEGFTPQVYWKLSCSAKMVDGSTQSLKWLGLVDEADTVLDTRNKNSQGEDSATFNEKAAREVINLAKHSNLVVTKVTRSDESISPPLGLNTVALLEVGSKAMGMSPKGLMKVAETLYSSGFISYPRTETTRYDPIGFDAKSLLRQHSSHPDWGKSASYLVRTRKSNRPPSRGFDAGDHPPITPLKSATRNQIGGGAAWRVYEFVTRNFIGSLHNDLKFTRTKISLAFEGSRAPEFEFELVSVDSLGFADACRWVLKDIQAGNKDAGRDIQVGDVLPIASISIDQKNTRPPKFLQEHELIRQMDDKRIGTDASMALHVSNIVDRGYVMLTDETGTPLRPPRPPGKRKQNQPRQIGRFMVPTPLGSSLLELFGHQEEAREVESPALLSHPSIRRQMEEEVKLIAEGKMSKVHLVKRSLKWFEDRYIELESNLTRDRVGEFGQGLCSTNEHLRRLRQLDAFEPLVTKGQVDSSQRQRGKSGKSSASRAYNKSRSNYKGGGKKKTKKQRSKLATASYGR